MTTDVDAETVMCALNDLLETEGLSTPSLRRLGQVSRQSHSTIASRFAGKAEMLARAAACFVERYDEQLQRRAAWGGWEGFLPRTQDDMFWLRVRAAWVELGRSSVDVGVACARLVDAEFALLRRTASERRPLGASGEPPDEWVQEAHLLLLGLWERLLARTDPISRADALLLWSARLRTSRLLSA